MTFGEYRRQYYPNFTFSDEKVKFGVRHQQGTITQTVLTPTVQVKPKIQVQDLLTAYLTIPI